MKTRCYNVNTEAYKLYGARGIQICKEWKNDFSAFHTWAINNGYQNDLQIDRVDTNGNYEPGNCRWVTSYIQNRNKRNNHFITICGETKVLKDWCRELNINYKSIHGHVKRKGVTTEELIREAYMKKTTK